MIDALKIAQQTQEAYCLRHGISVTRQFTDAELDDASRQIASVERQLFPHGLPKVERFTVIATTPDGSHETLGVLAADACEATMMAIELLYDGIASQRPRAIKIKVEPVVTATIRLAV